MGSGTKSCLWIYGAACATNGNLMNMYCSNFNMPVPNLFSGSSDCDNGFMAARYNNIGSTSHALSNFYPGYEFAFADSLITWWADEGTDIDGYGCHWIRWYRPSGQINYFASQVHIQLDTCPGWCSWQWYEGMVNTGIAGWEICDTSTSTHCAVSCVTNISGSSVAVGACTVSFDLGGVPSTSQCSSSLVGMIWVEGNNLNYINANQWEHVICGDNQGSAFGNCGSIWIDNSHYIHWVGADGNDYRAPWRICQFASIFSNGAPSNPSPGSSYAGNIWVDNQFGWTHLAYIGCDGNKYLAGGGHYPYSL